MVNPEQLHHSAMAPTIDVTWSYGWQNLILPCYLPPKKLVPRGHLYLIWHTWQHPTSYGSTPWNILVCLTHERHVASRHRVTMGISRRPSHSEMVPNCHLTLCATCLNLDLLPQCGTSTWTDEIQPLGPTVAGRPYLRLILSVRCYVTIGKLVSFPMAP